MISITPIKSKVNHKLKVLAMSLVIGVAILLPLSGTALAQVSDPYSSGAYGEGYYPPSPNTADSGSLANTGENVVLIIAGAAVCIGVGGLILGIRKSRKRRISS